MIFNFNFLSEDLLIPLDNSLLIGITEWYLRKISLELISDCLINLSNVQGSLVIHEYSLLFHSSSLSTYHIMLRPLNTETLGQILQIIKYQLKLKNRLHLTFNLLSDRNFLLKHYWKFLVSELGNLLLYKRLTMILKNIYIKKIVFPYFPFNIFALQVTN